MSANNSREIHKLYFVTVFPSVDSEPSTFTTENNTFQLSLLYNHEYAVSVVAKNCAGNSTPVNITVNISESAIIANSSVRILAKFLIFIITAQDMSPMHPSNVTIESDNDVEVEGELMHRSLKIIKKEWCVFVGIVALQPKLLLAICRLYGNGVGHHKVGQ